MEIRRVQMTGGASFVVTLPRIGLKNRGIKKNDPVGLIVQPDGTLLVTKKVTEEPLQKIKEIDGGTDPAFLFRLLIGTYLTGLLSSGLRQNNGSRPLSVPLFRIADDDRAGSCRRPRP